MTLLTGLLALVGASLLLWLTLVGLAMARKLRRDHRESRSRERRGRYQAVLDGGDVAAIAAICRDAGTVEAQVDLAVSIDAVYPSLPSEAWEAIGAAMQASPLFASLSAKLGSRRPVTRARAALVLTRPGIPAVVDLIVPLLGDPDPDVRLVACSGLARAGTPRAAEVLIWGLATRAVESERIIERLGALWAVPTILLTLQTGPPTVADQLTDIVPSGREVELDASLARALGIAGDRRGGPALSTLLERESVEVRVCAARALGQVGGTAWVPALIAALSADAWPVRAQAAKSLGALRAADALAPLERCLSDRSWWVRANAARALRELGEPGIEALRRALDHDDRYASDRAREQLALHAAIQEHLAG